MKKIFSILIILLALGSQSQAQIFMVSDEENFREEVLDPNLLPFIPGHDANWDQGYAPLGSGVMLLAGLAGAYLLGKKKKK